MAYGLASLAAVLLITLGLVAAQLAAARASTARLSTQAQTQQRTLDLLDAPGSVVMRLAPTATQVKGASATMILDPARGQGALLTSHLPALPTGKTYEFWLVLAQGDGKQQTTPILVFAGSSSASVTVFFSTSASASAVRGAGVSVEHSGGVHTPDSPMLLNTP